MKVVSQTLLFLSILCYGFVGVLLYQRYSPSTLVFANIPAQVNERSEILPMQIIIDSIGVNLPISEAAITNKSWQTSEIGLSYLVTSPLPGTKGNSILYGHNYMSILGKLKYTRIGDEIEIYFTDSTSQVFKIIEKKIVSTDNTTVLQNTGDTRITVYTCIGLLDLQRLVITAVPLE